MEGLTEIELETLKVLVHMVKKMLKIESFLNQNNLRKVTLRLPPSIRKKT